MFNYKYAIVAYRRNSLQNITRQLFTKRTFLHLFPVVFLQVLKAEVTGPEVKIQGKNVKIC